MSTYADAIGEIAAALTAVSETDEADHACAYVVEDTDPVTNKTVLIGPYDDPVAACRAADALRSSREGSCFAACRLTVRALLPPSYWTGVDPHSKDHPHR